MGTFEEEQGIVAWGGTPDPGSLILAYERGIFPWPIEGLPLPWFCPPRRAILKFSDLHISRSLKRFMAKNPYTCTLDQEFGSVISKCAEIHNPTWITPEMAKGYTELSKLGRAHSVEVWKGKSIVGGLYGVDAGGAFSCESMFHTADNASKIAILFLVDHLKGKGLEWMDIQQLTPHMHAMGATEITRARFLKLLKDTQNKKLTLFASG